MKIILTYCCEDCLEWYGYPGNTEETDFLCPQCGREMQYLGTEEVDESTNKVVKRYKEEERVKNHPGRPIVTCPYCKSTFTKKINQIFGLGLASLGKQWHCNNCGSDF